MGLTGYILLVSQHFKTYKKGTILRVFTVLMGAFMLLRLNAQELPTYSLSQKDSITLPIAFQPLDENADEVIFTTSFSLRHAMPDSGIWVLTPGGWDEVKAVITTASGIQETHYSGHLVPDQKKGHEYWYRYPDAISLRHGRGKQLPISLGPNESVQIHLECKMHSGSPSYAAVHVFPNTLLSIEKELRYMFLQLLFLGMIIALILYHALLFLTSWDKAYLYYALYMVSIALFTLEYSGILAEQFIPNHPGLRPYAKSLADIGIIIWYMQLFRLFVDTPGNFPIWDPWIKWTINGAYIYLVFSWIWLFAGGSSHFLLFANVAVSIVPISFILLIAKPIMIFGRKPAKYFLVGSLFLVLGNLINFGLLTAGIGHREIFGLLDRINFSQAGALLELLLFSVGLGHRTRIMQMEQQRATEIQSLKSRFFANVSHEFRTPLSLILGPVSELKSRTNQEDELKTLSVIERNANRLLNLINQLLALSKMEGGKMKIRVGNIDLVPFVRSRTASFESLANSKSISLVFESFHDSCLAWVDKDKMEKVFNNLVGNAIKFTPERGSVRVEISCEHDLVEIRVRDTGPGILPKHLPNIFDRFYQANSESGGIAEGSGIGLAYSKELVELHGGTISVSSKINEGSVFTVSLKKGNAHFKQEVLEDGNTPPQAFTEQNDGVEPPFSQEPSTSQKVIPADTQLPKVLIVEDNPDLQNYLTEVLGEAFHPVTANNGQEGWEKVQDLVPDLVISDLMMPEMNGYELCHNIKSDPRINHIPVIILTAKSQLEDKIKGLELGADDYLPKPFQKTELLARSLNLIRQRERLRESFNNWVVHAGKPAQTGNPVDQKFVAGIKEIIELNFQDPSFNVEAFAREAGLSRKHLNRKLQALLNTSPTELIRSYRLEKSARMLQLQEGTISQIAYDVGFNNLSYFSKNFKEHFGKTPSEYLKEHQNP